MRDRADVLAVAAYALLSAGLVALAVPPAVGVVLLTPLVVFAPGYAVLEAFDARANGYSLPRRCLWSVALSMGSVVLGGIAINAVAPLTAASWAIWLGALTLVACVVGLIRRRPQDKPLVMSLRPVPALGATLVCLAVVLFVAASAVITELNARDAYNQPITQLVLMPTRANARMLSLSVANLSQHSERARITVRQAGRLIAVERLSLRPSGSWMHVFAEPARSVTASLFLGASRTPSDQVVWTPQPAT